MGFKLKRALAALGVAACVAVPTFADTTFYANAVSQGGAFSTTAITKKTTPTGVPATMSFTALSNYDPNPTAHPLAARVRNASGAIAVSGVQSVYGTGTCTFYYYSGYGIYGEYLCRTYCNAYTIN
ncbi:MAG: hypothetical protein V8S84_09230 [Lachnospiraceae bacterium]